MRPQMDNNCHHCRGQQLLLIYHFCLAGFLFVHIFSHHTPQIQNSISVQVTCSGLKSSKKCKFMKERSRVAIINFNILKGNFWKPSLYCIFSILLCTVTTCIYKYAHCVVCTSVNNTGPATRPMTIVLGGWHDPCLFFSQWVF